MLLKTNGKNLTITKTMSGYLEKKMGYLDKFLKDNDVVNISVSKRGQNIKIEAYLEYQKKHIKARIEEPDYYAAVDKIVENLKNQIGQHHKKITSKSRNSLKEIYKKELEKETEEEFEKPA